MQKNKTYITIQKKIVYIPELTSILLIAIGCFGLVKSITIEVFLTFILFLIKTKIKIVIKQLEF